MAYKKSKAALVGLINVTNISFRESVDHIMIFKKDAGGKTTPHQTSLDGAIKHFKEKPSELPQYVTMFKLNTKNRISVFSDFGVPDSILKSNSKETAWDEFIAAQKADSEKNRIAEMQEDEIKAKKAAEEAAKAAEAKAKAEAEKIAFDKRRADLDKREAALKKKEAAIAKAKANTTA